MICFLVTVGGEEGVPRSCDTFYCRDTENPMKVTGVGADRIKYIKRVLNPRMTLQYSITVN